MADSLDNGATKENVTSSGNAMEKYIDENEAKLKPGAKVLVHHGPLKGLTGRLVRQSGKYYLLKEVPGMAVMLKVTKWCCKEC